jgi:hypothetical protein
LAGFEDRHAAKVRLEGSWNADGTIFLLMCLKECGNNTWQR